MKNCEDYKYRLGECRGCDYYKFCTTVEGIIILEQEEIKDREKAA